VMSKRAKSTGLPATLKITLNKIGRIPRSYQDILKSFSQTGKIPSSYRDVLAISK
jgi:hypothetical protein